GRVRNQRGRPSDMLQPKIVNFRVGTRIGKLRAGLDGLVLVDARDRPPDLDPAAVLAGFDPVQLGERVVSVLLEPEVPRRGIKGHAEGVSDPISEDLLDVSADLA